MARDLRSLSGLLFGNRVDLGGEEAVIGELLWATLRGLVMAQMLTSRTIDSTRERLLLVDLITGMLDGHAA
jgi:hypothetical protein